MYKEDKTAALRQNISLLGKMLGHSLKTLESTSFYTLEEQLRALSKEARKTAEPNTYMEIQKLIHSLSAEELGKLARAFGVYFQLVNLSEQLHRIRRKHDYEHKGETIKYSLEHLKEDLDKKKLPKSEVVSLLESLHISPVLTAHPTHIMRDTILQKHRRITRLLIQLENHPTPKQKEHFLQALQEEVSLLWGSDLFHQHKISLMDEVDNLLRYFKTSLWETLAQVHEDLAKELDCPVPNMIGVGSWVGGDRDGHPLVNAQVTSDVLEKQKAFTLKAYISAIETLHDKLSLSSHITTAPEALLQSIQKDSLLFPEEQALFSTRYQNEVYRQKLSAIHLKLKATLEHDERGYPNPQAFKEDLYLIEKSLSTHLKNSPLKLLLRQVEIFGFHLASLDIRQDSEVHLHIVDELFKRAGVNQDYLKLNENEKCALLKEELQNPRPLIHPYKNYSAAAQECFALFQVISQAHQTQGKHTIQKYIISMCHFESDILHVLLLAKEFGFFNPTTGSATLHIVPLFETTVDLEKAPDIMSRLYQTPLYNTMLKQRDHQQEIMLGYSDSAKKSGIFPAHWTLYKAQNALSSTGKKHGVQVHFFHGRGGSISRGGGPTHHAILAQPPQSNQKKIRITEQGEVLSWKYNFPELAHRNLSVLLSSLIEVNTQERPTISLQAQKCFEELSQKAQDTYQKLVSQPDFIAYFSETTPLEAISSLNIGSRPARRKNTVSIHDLRAIPWVFSWTQTRCILPAWFGVGSALAHYAQSPTSELELKEHYQNTPFFKVFIDNLQMTLSKADLGIAERYAQLTEDPAQLALWEQIKTEYLETRQRVLNITGQEKLLDNSLTLQKSIALRNPYVDPLNYIQVEILKRLKTEDTPSEKEALNRALKLTIIGISEGLRNTG